MHFEIGLTISVKICPAKHDAAFDRRLENAGLESGALPGDQARQANTREAWAAFLDKHPSGAFTDLAKYQYQLTLVSAPPPLPQPPQDPAGDNDQDQTAKAGYHYVDGLDPKGNKMAAINARCLEGFDPQSVPVKQFNGRAL